MVLTEKEKEKINRYFNAANYLSVGQLYLKDNPLLKKATRKKRFKKESSWSLGYCSYPKFYLYPFK